jgi:hypothetical protein
MGDGHLQGDPRWQLFFTSNSTKELLRFEGVIFGLFGIKGKIRPCTTNRYGTMNYSLSCSPLSRLLHHLGVPVGEKVSQEYFVPDWIVHDKECFRSFVRRYFDCEGTVDLTARGVSISTFKKECFLNAGVTFMNQLSTGLKEYFDIVTCRPFIARTRNFRKDGSFTQGVYLKIKSKEALGRFARFIGFETPVKAGKLLQVSPPMSLLKFV